MNLLTKHIATILLIAASILSCHTQGSNVISLDGRESPPATIELLEWIEGSWQGEAFGGTTEEVWSASSSGTMMGMFKLISDDEISFYELLVISEEAESLVLRLKHFGKDMKSWEEKDEVVEFPFVKSEKNRVYFDGLTFEKLDKDHINVYVLIKQEDSEAAEVKFPFTRTK